MSAPITAVVCSAPGRRRKGHLDAGWTKVEIIGDHESGQLVLREVGKFWSGIWLADRDQVRLAGPEFEVPR